MKIVSNGDNFTIYLIRNNSENIDVKNYVKETVIKLKDKLKKYISGYYEAIVYINNNYGMIIELTKESDFDFFKDFIELDITIKENSTIYLKFKDYFSVLNKGNIYYYNNYYYADIDKLNKKELLYLTEFGETIHGANLDNVKDKLAKVEWLDIKNTKQ